MPCLQILYLSLVFIRRENPRRSGILLFPDRPRFWDVAKTGNGERGTENGSLETSVKRYPLENSKWRTKEKKREQFGEMRGSVFTVVNVSFYQLCFNKL